MAICNGNELAKKLYVGNKPVRAVYAGSRKVWPSVVRVARGENSRAQEDGKCGYLAKQVKNYLTDLTYDDLGAIASEELAGGSE